MNKKFIMMIPSVAVTLVVAGFVYYARVPKFDPAQELNASLESGGATLEDNPQAAVNPSYDLSSHQTLSRVILLIRENYVEPERINSYDMFLAALDYIQKTVPEVLVDDSKAPERVKISVRGAEQTFDLGGLDQLWEVTMALRDIFRFLQTQLADPDERREVEYAAINGMLSTLDPHSVLLKPENFDEVKLSTKGEFGGLGIVISIRDGALTVISPIEGTPAARAGVRAKDRIIKIGEESTVNMNLEEAVQRLRGKPGTKINVWLLRKGWTEAKRFSLTRAIIKIESVSSELLADGIGYVKIKSFQNNTYDDLHDHLEGLRKKNKGELKGLVLDLRNNPGGLLDQAILVSDRFLEKGPIVITVGESNRKREEKDAHAAGTERNYPMVVLVNGGSASASEIVSGALKNQDRALIIGQQTFGKGSVQVLYDFKDKSALKLTIAQYLTPGDVSIQSVGISPDVEIVPATVTKEAVRLFVDDESPREKDLEKHLSRHGEGAELARPALRLTHLSQAAEPAPSDGGEEREQQAEKFDYDFETHLAHDVLAAAQQSDRKALLEGALPLFRARAADEEKRIEERMKELGVDWSSQPSASTANSPAALQAELRVGVRGKPGVKAGDTLSITGSVRNTGTNALYRVYGVSKSDNPLLKNLEFVFGKVDPGESRSWSVEVKLPEEMTTRADTVTLKASDQGRALDVASRPVLVTIDEPQKPRFAYTLWIDDRQKGDGDGLPQAGERIDLGLDVTNVGTGEAKEVVVALKNMSGESVFLERGREKLGSLKPGASKSTSLRFSLREGIESHAAELRVTIWDTTLGATLSEAIKLPVLPAHKSTPDLKMVKVTAKEDIPIYASALASAPVIAYGRVGALLRSEAKLEPDWRRVEVQNGNCGFVRDADIRDTKNALRATPKQSIRLEPGQTAPVVEFAPFSFVTSASVFPLKATLRDERRLSDVFVFVNDKKIFYRSLGLSAKSSNNGVTTPIEVPLPLKDGANSITVVVRENDDLLTRKSFGMFRAPADAVAGFSTTSAAPPQVQ